MDWLTQEEIKEFSKTKRGAIRGSRIHWEQMKDATPEELEEAYDGNEASNKTSINPRHCALCVKYRNPYSEDCIKDDERCVLWELPRRPSGSRCGPEYHNAEKAFKNRHNNWQAWKEASTKMWQRLVNEEAKCDIEDSKEPKEEKQIRVGNRYKWHSGSFVIVGMPENTSYYAVLHNNGIQNTWSEKAIRENACYIDNIFDDLSQEDLEEFVVGYSDNDTNPPLRIEIADNDKIALQLDNSYFTAKICQFQKLHRKLGRLIATAKKRKCKDGDC